MRDGGFLETNLIGLRLLRSLFSLTTVVSALSLANGDLIGLRLLSALFVTVGDDSVGALDFLNENRIGLRLLRSFSGGGGEGTESEVLAFDFFLLFVDEHELGLEPVLGENAVGQELRCGGGGGTGDTLRLV